MIRLSGNAENLTTLSSGAAANRLFQPSDTGICYLRHNGETADPITVAVSEDAAIGTAVAHIGRNGVLVVALATTDYLSFSCASDAVHLLVFEGRS